MGRIACSRRFKPYTLHAERTRDARARATSFQFLGADFSRSRQRTRMRACIPCPFSMQCIWFESPEAGGSNYILRLVRRRVLSACVHVLLRPVCIFTPILMSISRGPPREYPLARTPHENSSRVPSRKNDLARTHINIYIPSIY
jgi:hypothetical protein